jgi:hypothetical protein
MMANNRAGGSGKDLGPGHATMGVSEWMTDLHRLIDHTMRRAKAKLDDGVFGVVSRPKGAT